MVVKKLFYITLCLLLTHGAFAKNGERSRILVHTLNYISHDYQFAVANGKIISEEEYEEEEEFAEAAVKYFKLYSPEWSDADSAEIGAAIIKLDGLIRRYGSPKEVSTLATETKNRVIKASGLIITPTKYPNLQTGKVIFRTECSKCHGTEGFGDGPEGKELNPKPRNFREYGEMKIISPFTAFNTIRLGIEGTGMKAHPTLDDGQVWDVAFYVVSLRYQSFTHSPVLQQAENKKFLDSLSLGEIATTSDEEFVSSFRLKDTVNAVLASIRLQQPALDESEFINTSLKYLDGAMELYKQGKREEAAQLAALAYLEGIEPVENQLKASDPALLQQLEEQMQGLRKMMADNRPVIEIKDSLHAVRATVSSMNHLLNKKNYSFWLAFLLAASVLLREGIEAFLVILVILSILKTTELKNYKRWIHAGWICAIFVGIALWLFGGKLMKEQLQHVELIEGTISFVAVAMLLYVGFWLHGKSEINKWKDYVSKLTQGVVSGKSVMGLAGLSFFVVFREVFESVLFLSALNIESGGEQSNAIVLGVLAALLVVLALASLVLKFSTKLPITGLFKISSFVMGVLAVILTGKGIHSFQVMNLIPVHSIPLFRFELLGIYSTAESFGAQMLVLLAVAIIWKFTVSAKK